MPALTLNEPSVNVVSKVEQRVKGQGRNVWLARKSYHPAQEVGYQELDVLLAQDHAKKEADYTPSVFDANELLKWDAQVLSETVKEMKPEWRVEAVQISCKSLHALCSNFDQYL